MESLYYLVKAQMHDECTYADIVEKVLPYKSKAPKRIRVSYLSLSAQTILRKLIQLRSNVSTRMLTDNRSNLTASHNRRYLHV